MNKHLFVAISKKELLLLIDELVLNYIHPYYLQEEDEAKSYPTEGAKSILRLINLFRNGMSFIVEYPYTDKLYRDAYTHFYSRQHQKVDRECIRVLLFNCKTSETIFDEPEEVLNNGKYYGYFIIKPTQPISYGRNFLNPKVFKNSNFICCLTEGEAHLLGKEIKTVGFPHSTQDGIVHSCAETSIWSLMEYFGTKYSYYGTILPSQIHRIQKKVSFERQLPSSGMEIHQITYALRKLGFGSVYYTFDENDPTVFKKLVNDYIESGIPIILMTVDQNEHSGHAMILAGHNLPKNNKYMPSFEKSLVTEIEVKDGKEKITNCFGLIDSSYCFDRKYVAFDDNKPPYQLVCLNKPLDNYSDPIMKNSECFALAVPLYPKVFLDAIGVRDLFNIIIKFDFYGATCFNKNDIVISRFLLTSSKSYKMWLGKMNFDNEEFDNLLKLPMPKFIWLVELSRKREYSEGLVNAFMIFDSTASKHDYVDNYLMAAFYSDKIIINNNNGTLKASKEKKLSHPIRQYVNNLKTF